MVFSNHTLFEDPDGHHWAVVKASCDLSDAGDPLLAHTVGAIRQAYGEEEIRRIAESTSFAVPEPADGLAGTFDLSAVMRAFRKSLPDPDSEGGKPDHLTNYRSETAELLARGALATVYGFLVPPALHATKGNRSQPILGFDGWTVGKMGSGEMSLVLIQVKGTEDQKRPPGVAADLVTECGKAITDKAKLNDYLMACTVRCAGTEYAPMLLGMALELETTGKISNTILSPIIIRGKLDAEIEDLRSLRDATNSYSHGKARGMALSVGAELTKFGRTAMTKARDHG